MDVGFHIAFPTYLRRSPDKSGHKANVISLRDACAHTQAFLDYPDQLKFCSSTCTRAEGVTVDSTTIATLEM